MKISTQGLEDEPGCYQHDNRIKALDCNMSRYGNKVTKRLSRNAQFTSSFLGNHLPTTQLFCRPSRIKTFGKSPQWPRRLRRFFCSWLIIDTSVQAYNIICFLFSPKLTKTDLLEALKKVHGEFGTLLVALGENNWHQIPNKQAF